MQEFNTEGVFVAFQFKNNSKMVHIVSFNNNTDNIDYISHGLIQLPEVAKYNTVSKFHCATNIFHQNYKKNRNEYKKFS